MRYRRGRPRKTTTRSRSSAILLLCTATEIGLPAQMPLNIPAGFSGTNGSERGHRNQGNNGNFWGTTAGGGANLSGTPRNNGSSRISQRSRCRG